MRVALKARTEAVDALGPGEQIALLRKRGVRATRRGFEVRHPELRVFASILRTNAAQA